MQHQWKKEAKIVAILGIYLIEMASKHGHCLMLDSQKKKLSLYMEKHW